MTWLRTQDGTCSCARLSKSSRPTTTWRSSCTRISTWATNREIRSCCSTSCGECDDLGCALHVLHDARCSMLTAFADRRYVLSLDWAALGRNESTLPLDQVHIISQEIPTVQMPRLYRS